MSRFITVTPPSVEPITLVEAKRYLRLSPSFTADDADVEMAITAARERFEKETGTCVAECGRVMVIDRFPALNKEIIIDDVPIAAITKIVFNDPDGVALSILLTDLYIDTISSPARVKPRGLWPPVGKGYNAVEVHYKAGYSPAALPRMIRIALLRMTAHNFENRNEVTETTLQALPGGVAQVIALFRKMPLR